MTRAPLPRRTLLKGLGVSLGIPFLEGSMAWGARPIRDDWTNTFPAGGNRLGRPPLRMGCFFFPNGAHMADWTPGGKQRGLPWILEPFAPVNKQLLIINGLRHDKARANGDGPGDHARSVATFLTGVQIKKTAGKDIRCGISVDQLAAQQVGYDTLLPSIELGVDRSLQGGACDSGYSCIYSSNISWRSPTTAMAKETKPQAAFKRLFIDPNQAVGNQRKASEISLRKSVLDLVREDAKRLSQQLGSNDKRKLDEYQDAVRELEKRINHTVERGSSGTGAGKTYEMPAAQGQGYEAHMKQLLDILALAWQTDTTRIASFLMASGNRSYPHIGVKGGHHSLSHHGGDNGKLQAIRKINRHHMELMSYFAQKLSAMPEGKGSVLDNSMIVCGSGISDGDRHNHDNLPVIMLGSGSGSIRSGRILNANANMCDLYLAMLHRMGVKAQAFGDSNKALQL